MVSEFYDKRKKVIIKGYEGVENFKALNSGAVITCNHLMHMTALQWSSSMTKHNNSQENCIVLSKKVITQVSRDFMDSL